MENPDANIRSFEHIPKCGAQILRAEIIHISCILAHGAESIRRNSKIIHAYIVKLRNPCELFRLLKFECFQKKTI